MPRIRVYSPAGLVHGYSGFRAWGPGEYDFPDDARFVGWLQGQIDQGKCRIIPAVVPEQEPVAKQPRGRKAKESE